MGEDAGSAASEAAGAVDRAHRGLLSHKDLQFQLTPAPKTEPPTPPDWLARLMEWIGEMLGNAAPVFEVLFWALVAAAVAGILYLIVREAGGLDWAFKRKAKTPGIETQYRPDAQVAHALLADADALAAEGRFAEAVHVLLLRSIDDMRRWRPRALQPSLTSRDIGRLEVLPAQARSAFSAMAQLVETSLFGGRSVDAAGFAASRKAYEAFAFEGTWA